MYLYTEWSAGGPFFAPQVTPDTIATDLATILASAAGASLTRLLVIQAGDVYDMPNLTFSAADSATQLPLLVSAITAGTWRFILPAADPVAP